MRSERKISIALFLILNLVVLSTISSACGNKCRPPSKRKPKPKPKPQPKPQPPSRKGGGCSNALKFGVCGELLRLRANFTLGDPPRQKCCTVMTGMISLEAAVCVCTALKANILGAKIDIPISFSFLLSACSKKVPHHFKCS